jgi:Ni,Fe-hydrogenase III large subunit
MNACWEDILEINVASSEEYYRWERNQDHLVFKSDKNLVVNCRQFLKICQQLQRENVYLVTIVANDERYLIDGCFKLYYVFSHAIEDQFLILEYPLQKHDSIEYQELGEPLLRYLLEGRSYPSLRLVFGAAESFEREILDFFDLAAVVIDSTLETSNPIISFAEPYSEAIIGDFSLLNPDSRGLAPLNLGRKVEDIKEKIERSDNIQEKSEFLYPVGPIHAGVIASSQFSFHLDDEVIEDVLIQPGLKQKEIEKLFQTKFTLLDGWQMAEKISGDSAFSHSLAYCHAVEALGHIQVPVQANLVRGLFLELERLYNHIGNCALLANDVGFSMQASEMEVIREYLLRLNAELTGHRFLRGVNRPGGIILPSNQEEGITRFLVNNIVRKVSQNRYASLSELVEKFRELGEFLLNAPSFREKALNSGILGKDQTLKLGTTGLVARASGIIHRDFRVHHPFGIYQQEPELQRVVDLLTHFRYSKDSEKVRVAGDVFSRLHMRLYEVKTSLRVIQEILERIEITSPEGLIETHIYEMLRRTENFEYALGYVESWQGDIVYWIMKDRFNKIFRCKVRDPSFLNLSALQLAVVRNDPAQPNVASTHLQDFPFINKSFNLSFSDYDLL